MSLLDITIVFFTIMLLIAVMLHWLIQRPKRYPDTSNNQNPNQNPNPNQNQNQNQKDPKMVDQKDPKW